MSLWKVVVIWRWILRDFRTWTRGTGFWERFAIGGCALSAVEKVAKRRRGKRKEAPGEERSVLMGWSVLGEGASD